MTKYSKKTSLSGSRAVNKQNSPVIKPLTPKPKTKQSLAASFFQPRTPATNPGEKIVEEREEKAGNESQEAKVTAQENTENRRNEAMLLCQFQVSEILKVSTALENLKVSKLGVLFFCSPSKVWTEKARGGRVSDLAEDKKRKRPPAEEDEVQKSQEQKSEDTNVSKKSKPLDPSTNNRLSAFAFKQS
ncbi:WDHD1 protein, partial [Sylvietta virens]|nr:WDHD1 protein [Sylvietta virens]